MTPEFKVTFLPDAAQVWVPAGATLLQAAAAANVAIDAPCGDRGICGKCRVRVLDHAHPPTVEEKTLIAPDDIRDGWRLACQTVVTGDATVQVPERALQPAIVPLAHVAPGPAVQKVHLNLPEPSIDDAVSDLARLRRGLGGHASAAASVGLPLLRKLPGILVKASRDITAVAVGDELVDVEQGDTSARSYGVAVDLGTTSVVVMLADLNSGAVLGVESRLNGQANFGADVISRIHAVMDAGSVEPLQRAAVATIAAALDGLLKKTGVDRANVYEVVVVGNTCMNHLFLGVDPTSLAQAPYQPAVTEPVTISAASLGLHLNPAARVYTLPNVAGFVGSDTVAVVLATGMHRSEEIKLAIDLGTNGEMVLGNRHRLIACSTAAGPAFEGAKISCGMRATEGAIERVWIDGDELKLQVIGGGQPVGLCGSGLLDAIAQMRLAGILNDSGRMALPDQNGSRLPESLARRLRANGGAAEFVLGRRGKREVTLTQGDVRELQLAKGAIRAGISVLLKEFGIGLDQVSEILLAGAFGSFINPASVRTIDLIPWVPIERVTAVGNAAGQGAAMALLSTDLRAEAVQIAQSVQYVELSARPDFMDQFMDALGLGGGSSLSHRSSSLT